MASSRADWANQVPRLIEQLDRARVEWFRLTKEVLGDAGVAIRNSDFEGSAPLDIGEHETPPYFPFNTVSGESVEAGLLGLQILIAIHFIDWRKYVSNEQMPDFFAAWTAEASGKGERWTLGPGLWLSTDLSAFGGLNPAAMKAVGSDILTVLASYLAGAPPLSEAAVTVFSHMNLAPLVGFTQLGVAVAFDDSATAQELMAQMRPSHRTADISTESESSTAPSARGDPRYFVLSGATRQCYGPETFETVADWVRQNRVRLVDSIAKAGTEEWVPLARSEFSEFCGEFLDLLQDIEFGPNHKKIEAIGKLRPKHVPLHLVDNLLRRVLIDAADQSALKFVAAANLAALGDHSDTIVDALLPYLGGQPFEKADGLLYFGWLENLAESFPEGTGLGGLLCFSTQLASLEALSHIRGSERVAYALIRVLDVLDQQPWRIFAIYAIAAHGYPSSKSRLEYYRDRYSSSPEGEAATIGLENFGQKTPIELGQLHRERQGAQSKSSCAIATIIYGVDATELQILRSYRDKILSKSLTGRVAITFYSCASPAIARFLSRSSRLSATLRHLVVGPIVKICEQRLRNLQM